MSRDRFRRVAGLALAALLVAGLSTLVRAGGMCCLHCGCSDGCRKVCRLVVEDRKISTVCWGCECEDFCVHGCSRKGCTYCEIVCDDCEKPDGPHTRPKKLKWSDWTPHTCARIYTKKKLMKKTVTKTVPGFKWVVEELCPECAAACPIVEVPPGAVPPPPPVLPATPPAPSQAAERKAIRERLSQATD